MPHLHAVFVERCSKTAAAIAAPSEVPVPRPSSSSAIRLAGVALCKAAAVSASSTKKVDCTPESNLVPYSLS